MVNNMQVIIIFNKSSGRTKQRKTEELRKNTDLDVLNYITKIKLYEEGGRNASKLVENSTSFSSKPEEYRTTYSKTTEVNVKQLSPLLGLSMFEAVLLEDSMKSSRFLTRLTIRVTLHKKRKKKKHTKTLHLI